MILLTVAGWHICCLRVYLDILGRVNHNRGIC